VPEATAFEAEMAIEKLQIPSYWSNSSRID
jgi:hypothetical protein